MFAVMFEVHPRPEQWDAYLGNARLLKPELEQVDGFVDNVRYRSLTRDGWLLSLSSWRDEKSVVRWRTQMKHHLVQEQGRERIMLDYHLRVGEITADSCPPPGHALRQQRLDETEVGAGTVIAMIDASRPADWSATAAPADLARELGLRDGIAGLVSWDVLDAVLAPGDVILFLCLRDAEAAGALRGALALPEGARLRTLRVVRDYGMYDRREAPQYYPEIARPDEARPAA
ncbi:antibiotic biosynthesis monooxygenase family protein [Bordetella genomosp. 13]|uniref:antibiotic biosynthesis monooxygenase family protein n=1 Tax=Bordetella genomosp. 13 TaxID=463040 RepID=UPI00119F1FC3|nr:antibiotic biosynthesis monooxygenase [Bordetella genomosp. 13]